MLWFRFKRENPYSLELHDKKVALLYHAVAVLDLHLLDHAPKTLSKTSMKPKTRMGSERESFATFNKISRLPARNIISQAMIIWSRCS